MSGRSQGARTRMRVSLKHRVEINDDFGDAMPELFEKVCDYLSGCSSALRPKTHGEYHIAFDVDLNRRYANTPESRHDVAISKRAGEPPFRNDVCTRPSRITELHVGAWLHRRHANVNEAMLVAPI